MALKQANTQIPANVSETGFAISDARYIGGHRAVGSMAELYAINDWQLLNPDIHDTSLALGQEWYVKDNGRYRLTNWDNRKSANGWTKVVDPNNIDTTLFQIVTALPTSGIDKNRLYLVKTSGEQSPIVFTCYLYTGDTSVEYDVSKWEAIGTVEPKTEYGDNKDSRISSTEEKGFSVCDSNGNIGMKYDEEGLDAAKLSKHFISLLGLPSSGPSHSTGTTLLKTVSVDEDGLYFVDCNMNVGCSIDGNGLHTINMLEYLRV